MVDTDILPILKSRISTLQINIVNEDLTAYDVNYKRYNSINPLWVPYPPENVRVIVAGVETKMLPSTYAVNSAGGYITFGSARASTDVVRADYSFFPFDDTELTSIIDSARKQISSLVFRTITEPYSDTYQEAILKKCYTICLRKLQMPTPRYFSISVGGRTMGKENQVTQFETLIEGNEKELLPLLNVLRYFNQSNKLCL